MIKNNKIKISIISALIMVLIMLINSGITNKKDDLAFQKDNQSAQVGYVPLTNTGGGENLFTESDFESIGTILAKIFSWGIAIALFLSALFILLGSIQYMTTDAVFEKSEGITKIQSAIGGLILALVSWLILNTINEKILSFKIEVAPLTTSGLNPTQGQVNNLNETLDSGIQNSVNTNSSTNLPGGSNTTVTSGEIGGLTNNTTNNGPGNFNVSDSSFPPGVTDWSSLSGNNSN